MRCIGKIYVQGATTKMRNALSTQNHYAYFETARRSITPIFEMAGVALRLLLRG